MATTRTDNQILRERELVTATRALWDERGTQVAGVEEIARSVGIARGLIYRVFSSKDELFVLTVTSYLDELATELSAAISAVPGGEERLDRALRCYAAYCLGRPAYVDATLALMGRPAAELNALVSDDVWLRLGEGMAACLGPFAEILSAAPFEVAEPDLVANLLWAQILGSLQLARLGVGVARLPAGGPTVFPVDPETIVAFTVESARRAIIGAA